MTRSHGRYEQRQYWEQVASRPSPSRDERVLHIGAPQWFNDAVDRIQRRALQSLLHVLASHPPTVEIGCGVGRWQEVLAPLTDLSFGVDLSWSMLRLARDRGADRVVQGDIVRLPIRSGTAGSVLSVTVLGHLPHPLQEAALAEARRVSRAGGMLCMLEALGRGRYWHVFPRSPEEWVRVASDAGWSLKRWRGVEFTPLVRALRALARLRPGATGASVPPRSSLLRSAYRGALRAATAISLRSEPAVERILPARVASHGLFVFETSD